MSEHEENVEQALDGLGRDKRRVLLRLAKGAAFVAPVVAAFAMQGLSIRAAHAFPGSSSNKPV